LLEDDTDFLLLGSMASGESISVDINALAMKVGKHRNTIRREVLQLLERRVVNPAVCPFMGLYREYPLRLTMPRRRLQDAAWKCIIFLEGGREE